MPPQQIVELALEKMYAKLSDIGYHVDSVKSMHDKQQGF